MSKTGRKKKFQTVDEFGKAIADFIQYSADNNVIPTDYNLCKYLGIAYLTLYDYTTNKEDRYKGYANELKKLIAYRENYFLTLSLENPKAATPAIFALKQAKNGGYQDKPVVDISAKELTIVTKGTGNDAFE